MTSHDGTGTISVPDPLPVVLERMSSLATTVLGEHTGAAGWCEVCGSVWPCERVVLAEHNLAVI